MPEHKLNKYGKIYVIRTMFSLVVQGAIFFLAAGRLDILRAWIYLGVALVYYSLMMYLTAKKNPELINERGRPKKDGKKWDKIILILYGLIGSLGTMIIAGLDVGRYGWSDMSIYWIIPGLILLIAGSVLAVIAMLENTHFEVNVRIQKDRNHKVIDTGPYSIIRHPGYSGGVLFFISLPLVLGSWWAYIPAGLAVIILGVRTYLEDKTLRNELDGYSDYTRRVKYRLIPGIW